MQIEQRQWDSCEGWRLLSPGRLDQAPDFVLAFGGTSALRNQDLIQSIGNFYPGARVVGCSTGGEICDTRLLDDSLVLTAIRFRSSQCRFAEVGFNPGEDSCRAGEFLAKDLPAAIPGREGEPTQPLTHVIVFSDGLRVNGGDLLRGAMNALPQGMPLTGGLAGDGTAFQRTMVFKDSVPQEHCASAVGLYGARLKVGAGCLGGWDPFGPERVVTRAKGNVLYELNGRPALALYKQYLGDHAKGLPATGLYFPLSLQTCERESAIVRAFLSVDEREQSMTFAGTIPEGSYVRMMKTNLNRVLDAASGAAAQSLRSLAPAVPELAIIVSCVARRMVLRQRTEEELEAVRETIGPHAVLAGFYSYGEIAPSAPGTRPELHHQTMAVTTLAEV
jgi:hypothetical protein